MVLHQSWTYFYCKFRNYNTIRSDCTKTDQLLCNVKQTELLQNVSTKSLIHNHQCHFKLMALHWIGQMIQDCLPISPYRNKKCELILYCQLEHTWNEWKATSVLQWSGDHGLEIYNSWCIKDTADDNLQEYWHHWMAYCKPHVNVQWVWFYLSHNLK